MLNQWQEAQAKKEEAAALAAEKKIKAQQALAANADKEQYESVDNIIDVCIEEIWDQFDEDRGGTLDPEETACFVKHTL